MTQMACPFFVFGQISLFYFLVKKIFNHINIQQDITESCYQLVRRELTNVFIVRRRLFISLYRIYFSSNV